MFSGYKCAGLQRASQDDNSRSWNLRSEVLAQRTARNSERGRGEGAIYSEAVPACGRQGCLDREIQAEEHGRHCRVAQQESCLEWRFLGIQVIHMKCIRPLFQTHNHMFSISMVAWRRLPSRISKLFMRLIVSFRICTEYNKAKNLNYSGLRSDAIWSSVRRTFHDGLSISTHTRAGIRHRDDELPWKTRLWMKNEISNDLFLWICILTIINLRRKSTKIKNFRKAVKIQILASETNVTICRRTCSLPKFSSTRLFYSGKQPIISTRQVARDHA